MAKRFRESCFIVAYKAIRKQYGVAKNFLRKITVDGEGYFWYRGHFHIESYKLSPCAESLTVFRQTSRHYPLRILFKEEDNNERTSKTPHWNVGYPRSGVLCTQDVDGNCRFVLNLNRPKVVATLIRLVRASGWRPESAKESLVIENGLQFLDEHYESLIGLDESGGEKQSGTAAKPLAEPGLHFE